MLAYVIVAAVSALAGFGLGRVKNAGKLAAVKAELDKVEASVTGEAYKLYSKIKSVI